MRICLIPVAAVLMSFGSDSSSGGDKKKDDVKKKASVWMKAKIEYSRNIQAALTEGDFAKIEENARALDFTSYLEVWFRADRPDYKKQILLFSFANQELIRQAKAKDLYGATLAYSQLIVSCVQCHQIVRDAKKGRIPS